VQRWGSPTTVPKAMRSSLRVRFVSGVSTGEESCGEGEGGGQRGAFPAERASCGLALFECRRELRDVQPRLVQLAQKRALARLDAQWHAAEGTCRAMTSCRAATVLNSP
jgi:hypothetical protein